MRMKISGHKVELRPARPSDRKKIFRWLARSDLTPSIMGPPDYPDLPVPTWEEFCREYLLSFFSTSGDGRGRNYIIVGDGEEVGTVGYDLLDKQKDRAILDIWLRSGKYCGRGYGSDALKALCRYIHENFGIGNFIISPSARNKRAIAAYRKAGFEAIKTLNKDDQIEEFGRAEYDDSILMMKRVGPPGREG